jgi:hypothetical protein
MTRYLYLGSLLILSAVVPVLAGDVPAGEVRKIEIFPGNGEVRVEITLSTNVTPVVETAQDPDRLVVRLPGTVSAPQQKKVAVGQFGVRSVRFGLNQAEPPETRLVVDLDKEHPYHVSTNGTVINLTVEAPLSETARRRTPPGAAAGPFMGLGHKQGSLDSSNSSSNQSGSGVLLTPPPSGPPINFPPPPPAADSSAASNTQASARNPNKGSLQEGTAFPNEGAPGAGVMPPVTTDSGQRGIGTQNSKNGANAGPGSSQPQQTAAASTAPQQTVEAPKSDATLSATQPAAASNASSQPAVSVPAMSPASTPSTAATVPAAVPEPASAVPASVADNSAAAVAKSAPTPEPNSEVTPDANAAGENATESASNFEPAAKSGSGEAKVPQLSPRLNNSPDFRNAFRVKFVAQDSAYLDGGRAAGLVEGMKLVIRDLPNAGAVASHGGDSGAAGDIAELEVLSVAETSAVTEIREPKRPIAVGDIAYLSSTDEEALVQKNALSATRKYPAVVSFTDNDTLDDEARDEIPKPPLPSVNRARGRIGFDYIGVVDHGTSNVVTNNLGMVVRADITRLGGSYWNVRGYWRGRFDHTNSETQTLQDTINRTYHLYTDYTNPNSAWVAGFGRMYLPWATSLDTIDGGYFGRKFHGNGTSGLFLGSTPDPSSYSYDPHRQIGGAFMNFEGGNFEDLHYFTTTGAGVELNSWSLDRPFIFFENNILYKRVFSIYESTQLDSRAGYTYQTTSGPATQPATGFGLGRNFLTVRYQPHPVIELSVNHTYFRDLPTFDPNLVATGLLDKYLFQGFTGGVRIQPYKQIWLSAEVGQSNRSGDSRNSLNQLYGITFGKIPWIDIHADARYSRFNSGFGSGSYEALALSKNVSDTMQFQFLAGQQNFNSSLTSVTRSRFINGMIEYSLGVHYFVQGGATISRGDQMNYEQWIFTFGYRFDNRNGHRGQ